MSNAKFEVDAAKTTLHEQQLASLEQTKASLLQTLSSMHKEHDALKEQTKQLTARANREREVANSKSEATKALEASAAPCAPPCAAPPAACAKRGDDQIYKWLGTHFEEGGDLLDAGTGFGSLCWLLRRKYDSLTAVTATDEGMYGATPLREMTRNRNVSVVVGNWRDQEFLSDQTYDIVVADYLFGATERYWAYGADELLGRLLDRVRPGGTLLIVGLEPYELVLDRNDKDDKLVLEVEAVGDAAATAAFEPNYRELPERWIRERIARTTQFNVVATERFPMRLTARSLQRQLVFARDCLVKIEDDGLRAAFEARVRALDKELSVWARKGKSHRRARNYAIVVRRAAQEGEAAPKKPKRRFFGKN